MTVKEYESNEEFRLVYGRFKWYKGRLSELLDDLVHHEINKALNENRKPVLYFPNKIEVYGLDEPFKLSFIDIQLSYSNYISKYMSSYLDENVSLESARESLTTLLEPINNFFRTHDIYKRYKSLGYIEGDDLRQLWNEVIEYRMREYYKIIGEDFSL